MPLFLLSLLLAVQTPASAPSGQSPRLAIVVGNASQPAMQPSFERLANDFATRFAKRFSVTALPLPAGVPSVANPALCSSLGVVGFLIPGRHWHISSTTVTTSVRLIIFDCDGDRFFDDSAEITEARNHAMIPGAQIDSITSHATDMLLAKFAQFESGHQVLWSRFLATGSLRDTSPSPSPSP
jgi:hypothetical protein